MGQQFAPPPGGPPPQQSQQQYGAPPPQQQNYGAAPPQGARPGGLNVQTLVQTLQQCAMEQKVQGFYPPQALNDIAQKVAASGALEKVAQEWRLPMEIAIVSCPPSLISNAKAKCYTPSNRISSKSLSLMLCSSSTSACPSTSLTPTLL